MAGQKRTSKQTKAGASGGDVATQLEQAFLAGLGALEHAKKAGSETFESLVEKGKSFRGKSSGDTAEMIKDIQLVIRGVASNAQTRASGLMEQVREKPDLEEIQRIIRSRFGVVLEKAGGATRTGLDEMQRKLDRVLKAVEETGRRATAKKPATGKKKAAKKSAAGKKKTAKKTAAGKKKTAKKPRKKAARKSPRKKTATKTTKAKK